MPFNDSAVSEIKNKCNIVDVIGRVVRLKKTGSNYKGVCPFHSEKTPSFVVSETKQIFTCFGCGATGDVLEFVQRYYNLDFVQAMEKLASEYGIELKSEYGKNEKKDELYEINRLAARFFFDALTQKANPGYEYMRERGIEPITVKKFGIGYADGQGDSLYRYLKDKGYEEDNLLKLGLISESKGKYYDKFRNRVIFPIINTRGKIIGFGGRAIGDAMPKYLNSPENPIFQKKNNLYGLNLTRQDIGREDCAILVEGYMDVISLWQAGVKNVSASLGTALTDSQARLLSRYTRNIVLSYDADEAGRAAALRGLDILYREGLTAKVLHVTDGKDPDEFVKKRGSEAFKRLVGEALPYADYKIEALKRRIDTSSDEGRVKFFKSAVDMLRELSPIEADIYIKKISSEMKISEGALAAELADNNRSGAERQTRVKVEGTNRPSEASMLEKHLIKLMLTDPAYYDRVASFSHVFTGSSGNIFSAIKETYRQTGEINISSVENLLSDEDIRLLGDIRENVLLAGMEEQILADCIRKIEISDLKKREEELSMRLALAGEEADDAHIKDIMEEIAQIQRIINGQEVS